jgi:hypothetical protein
MASHDDLVFSERDVRGRVDLTIIIFAEGHNFSA